MVNITELVKQQSQNGFKLATVTELTESDTALVTFYGDTEQSQKGYSYLSSYKPQINDIVLMLPFGDTHIIIGKILLVTDSPIEFITPDYLDDVLSDYATTTQISGFITTADLSNYLNDGATASSLTINSLTANNEIVNGYFKHNGTLISFFNGPLAGKTTVSTLSSGATQEDQRLKINSVINLLKSYNLA